MSETPTIAADIEDIVRCNRMVGLSVATCQCRVADEGGWTECPDVARATLTRDFIEANLASLRAANDSAWGLIPAVAQRTSAHQQGFIGDICPTCGGARVIRNGTCELCLDCGTSVGGCS